MLPPALNLTVIASGRGGGGEEKGGNHQRFLLCSVLSH